MQQNVGVKFSCFNSQWTPHKVKDMQYCAEADIMKSQILFCSGGLEQQFLRLSEDSSIFL